MKIDPRFKALLIFGVVVVGASMAEIRVESSRSLSVTPKTAKDEKLVVELLHRLKMDLRSQTEENIDGIPGFGYVIEQTAKCETCPTEFKNLSRDLNEAYRQKHFTACADIADRMQALIPTEYVEGVENYRADFFSEWRTFVGNLRAMDNDYKGAMVEYEKSIGYPILPRSDGKPRDKDFPSFRGKEMAAFGRADLAALSGDYESADKYLKESQTYFRSFCGNCNDGAKHGLDQDRTVYKAACLPEPEAEVALLKLVAGGYVPLVSGINPDESREEILSVRKRAAFFLGERYLSIGNKYLAGLAFRAVAISQDGQLAHQAQSRLASLGIS